MPNQRKSELYSVQVTQYNQIGRKQEKTYSKGWRKAFVKTRGVKKHIQPSNNGK